MDEKMICGWEVDRGPRRPVPCDRPAKARAIENLGMYDRLVCGVHVRSARALGYDIEPLPGSDGPAQKPKEGLSRDNLPRRRRHPSRHGELQERCST